MSSSVAPLDNASDQTTDDKVAKTPEKSHHKGEFISWQSSLLIAA